MDINAIADFVIKYSPKNKKGKAQYIEEDRDKIKGQVIKHIQYKTCVILRDMDGIAAVCRYNISPSGAVAHILDLIIKPEYRNKIFFKRLLIKGLRIWPQVRFLEWERLSKYPNRERKFYSVAKMLKRSK
jgi:hypothetical protein